MAISRIPLLVLLALPALALGLSGCSRSPKEQLAYQHAEEQYQINQRQAERSRAGDESPQVLPVQLAPVR